MLIEDCQLFATLPCVQHNLCTSVTVCCKVLQSVTHCHTVLQSGAKCLHVLLGHLHLPIAVGESHNLPVCVPRVALHRTWAQLLYCGGHQVVLKLSQSWFKVVIARALVLALWKSSQSSWTSARCQSEGGVEHLVVVIAKERSTWQFFPNFATFAQLGNFRPTWQLLPKYPCLVTHILTTGALIF